MRKKLTLTREELDEKLKDLIKKRKLRQEQLTIEWEKKRKSKSKPKRRSRKGTAARANHIFRKYGLHTSEYEAILAAQNYKCAICIEPLSKENVDHNHDTKTVRGILCTHCNTGLGMFKDNTHILSAAIDYLVRHGSYSSNAVAEKLLQELCRRG